MSQKHQLRDPRKVSIPWRGKLLTVAEAGALAVAEQRKGNVQEALEIYDVIAARVPNSAEVHNNHGVLLQLLKRNAEALVSYEKAIAIRPDYANAHFNRAVILKLLNRFAEALESYDQAIALNPAHAEAHNNRGALLQQMRRYDDAIASYDKAIVAKADYAAAYNNRGTALLGKGNMPEAEKMFLTALKLRPDLPDPLLSLARMGKYSGAADAEKIRELLKRPGLGQDDKEHLYFALGKIYDDSGDYDEAFEYFRQANEIRNAVVSYDARAVTKLTDDIIAVFSREFLSQPFAFAAPGRLPLFIVGMPRSGTTLLASVLSNHHAIATAGELQDISDYASHLPELLREKTPYPEAARRLTPAVAAHIISEYEKRLRRDAGPNAAHIIDKNPLNFRHLGFIATLFPQARVIHCTRRPLDTGLSNYFTRFPLSLDYAFDLRNIGHFYGEYARLMAHWRMIPALKIMDVSYEDMILKTEQTARGLLEFLGLDWDDRCLSPHTNPAPVETASDWQVRQPIYKHSLDKWRHYEKYLGPLKEVLAAANVSV